MTAMSNYLNSKSRVNWDEYFMLQAIVASFRSKDPVTKVGCVFVDNENHQLSMGYNGFIAGVDESKLPWGKDKDHPLEHQKYPYVVHAEANAILHSSVSLKNSRCYVTHFPCHECAKMLASKKVKEVIYFSDKHRTSESTKISKRLFELTGIEHRQLEIDLNLLSELTKSIENNF